jgi:hydroxymethylpyrimidine/phosphomethylpyrimidine kinase
MQDQDNQYPVVMSFGALDPTGGAGLQADVEALRSVGCHPVPVATAITVQDTGAVRMCMPLSAAEVITQARALLEDVPVAAFKLGLLGSVEITEAIHTILHEYGRAPVVLDPVMTTDSGIPLLDEDVVDAMVALILPLTTVATAGSSEARRLAPGADSPDAAAHQILSTGCQFVLLSAEPTGGRVVNTLYSGARRVTTFEWPVVEGSFHGAGCTLAAALAGLLAHGQDPVGAVRGAQQYTVETLKHAYRIGGGRQLPHRLFWAERRREKPS